MPPDLEILFLPGTSGNTDFWRPVSSLLSIERVEHIGWPGFGVTPPDPEVTSVVSLASKVARRVQSPTALVAQSMGGVVALLAAMEKTALVTHLVIAALSGGLMMKQHGAREWQPPVDQIDPSDPTHLFAAYRTDLAPLLPSLKVPTLLLWGDDDPISPVAVDQWLSKNLPLSELRVIPNGAHTFCNTRASEVAPLIMRHLSA